MTTATLRSDLSVGGAVAPPATAPPGHRRSRLRDGRPGDPRWARPALISLLLGTGVLYLWGLSANGYANEFYAAAAQAGSVSWKALLFGSLDGSNSITVDKTPASLWAMGLSIRLFGLNSWALLVPEALMGVGTVALVVGAVRRTVGRLGPALFAGLAMALTPVAVLMFRFDNPDALLVLLLTGSAYALIRAMESPRALRWMLLAGALVGFGFLAKMLQAFLVLPGFALAYLLLGPGGQLRRIGHLAAAGAAMVVAAGWWVAIVQLWPASSRPYIGGSTTNSILELALGYNGISRISGSLGGPQTGTPGWLRMFGSELGGQVAWLLPAALLALVIGLVWTARAPRTDRVRRGLAVWGGWLVVTGIVFSLMAGVFHGYYTVALAPANAALVGIGAALLWEKRGSLVPRVLLGGGVLVTAVWSSVLLSRSADFLPWLRWLLLGLGLVAAIGLALSNRLGAGLRRGVIAVAVAAVLAGPTAYSVQTVTTAHTGSMPTAGPAVSGGTSGMGGPGGRSGAGGPGFGNGTPPSGSTAGGPPSSATTGTAGGTPPSGVPTGAAGGNQGGAGGGGSASSALVSLLERGSSGYTWVAATTGSQTAATYQLATQSPVMAIGGFTGSDASPTLAQFQADVAAGRIHYYLGGGGGGGGGGQDGQGSTAQIANWVAANYTATTVDGVTVYDLTT
jgi:4-amino-4-deoxy-L-arabinose transferase-like glycosyltransferase